MTPKEIITEALYNIYGSSEPDASVVTAAGTLMRRIYGDAQRATPWWFLERYFTCPAVNQNITSFRPDGVLSLPQEIASIAYRNGLIVVLVYESATVLRLYTVDPKTLTVQKCGSFARQSWQGSVELRYDQSTDKLFIRLEDNESSDEAHKSHVYEISEEGDIINTLTPAAPMNQSWTVFGGILYYVTMKFLVWDWSFQIRKLNGADDQIFAGGGFGGVTGLVDIAACSEGVVGLTTSGVNSSSAIIWFGTNGTGTPITSGGTYVSDKLMSHDDLIYIASKPSDTKQIRIRWFDSVGSNGAPEYTHKGSVTVYPWGSKEATIADSYLKNTVYFVIGKYMFVAERNADGTASLLRLTSEKMGIIYEVKNSQTMKVVRRQVGDPILSQTSGISPAFYTDEESSSGKRDITLFPQSVTDFVNIRAIVYNEMEDDVNDVVTHNLEDYLIKKLTAELSLKTEYSDRYAAYTAAAEEALVGCRRQMNAFAGQEFDPGYSEC